MLMWRTEENGIVIKGATAQYPHAVFIGNTDRVELIHVSNRLTPDELRQVADKLEELQGTKEEETGKVLWLRKGGKRGNADVHSVYDTADVRIGYFSFRFGIDREVFTQTVGRELSSAEVAAIKHFEKQLNFKL